ncbi:MAG: succinate dehydrogenase, cytochrome b556 subunit [Alphaproteobacteria bacterium]|nr:succinate dehydrogenase, cytochrome b556 subunit [Alphaproteobacteria bacterium]
MSEVKSTPERPLSPHLQVYRLPYNALMSISGRGVGIILSVVLMVLLGGFIYVAQNAENYDQVMALLKLPYVSWGLWGLVFLTFFYLGNGIRHVLWDIGIGLNQKAGIASGNIVLLLATILTLVLWQFSCGCWSAQVRDQDAPVQEEVENVR